MNLFKEIKEDLKTYDGNRWAPGYRVMRVYRFGRWRYKFSNPLLRKPLSLLYKILYRRIISITGIELPCEVPVGSGTRIDHHSDIIISGYAKIGENCIIRNGVTIGLKNIEKPVAPIIGNNVNIGSGAKLLGEITIGNNVTIGANAVVLKNIPDNSLVVGIPAKIIHKHE